MKDETIQQTPEPWMAISEGYDGWKFKGGWNGKIVGKDKEVVFAGPASFNALRGATEEQAKANARRICAAVNACEGLSTEWLEDNAARLDMIVNELVEKRIEAARLRAENERLREAMKEIAGLYQSDFETAPQIARIALSETAPTPPAQQPNYL